MKDYEGSSSGCIFVIFFIRKVWKDLSFLWNGTIFHCNFRVLIWFDENAIWFLFSWNQGSCKILIFFPWRILLYNDWNCWHVRRTSTRLHCSTIFFGYYYFSSCLLHVMQTLFCFPSMQWSKHRSNKITFCEDLKKKHRFGSFETCKSLDYMQSYFNTK